MSTVINRNGKYKTGLCGNGCCEGTNPKNVFGHALPTCTHWQTCSCKCHLFYDEMFKVAGEQRTAVDNSSYAPDKGDFVMPSMDEIIASRVSSSATQTSPPQILQSERPDVIPATVTRTYGPTPSGRAARGELESQVKWACDLWLVEAPPWACTPRWISEEIAKQYGIKPPSVGAIDAVLNRWVTIGFAIKETKPTRFSAYTEDGIKLTLEGCKQRAKRKKIKL